MQLCDIAHDWNDNIRQCVLTALDAKMNGDEVLQKAGTSRKRLCRRTSHGVGVTEMRCDSKFAVIFPTRQYPSTMGREQMVSFAAESRWVDACGVAGLFCNF
jgi:hypothetical protein